MIVIRNEKEIDLLREANRIVADVLVTLCDMVRPGVTTKALDARAEEMILDNKGTPAFKGYHGFPASTCISVEEEIVHGIPGDRVLQDGQIVSMDVGVFYKGYCGDAALSVGCGEIDKDRQRLMDTTDLALSRAIRAAREGNYLQDIGRAVQGLCEKAGYGVVRDFVGHGIGTEMHEKPQIPNFDTGDRGPKLKAGMVLAIEPMVNMGTEKVKVLNDGWTAVTVDGKPSAHFEHSIVVRREGGEILSASEKRIWGRRT
jgi:methionyl aminopeptidase